MIRGRRISRAAGVGLAAAALAGVVLAPAGEASTNRATASSTSATATLGTITEFPIAAANRVPQGIVATPAGGLYFTENAVTSLGVSSATGATSEISGLTAPAGQVTLAADGSVWATETGGGYIAKIAGGQVAGEWSTGRAAKPTGITTGPDGNVWFAQAGSPAAIGQITPSGTITVFSTGLGAQHKPVGITTGPDGNLWFTDQGRVPAIGQITPSGTVTEFSTGLNPGSNPVSITTGPDGNLWFTDQGKTPAIGRITPSGTITEFSTGLQSGATPTGITAGPDGNVYFTDQGGTGAIGDITPTGTITEQATPSTDSVPNGIVTSNGTVWFTEQGNSGQLAQLTPAAAAATPAQPVPVAKTLPGREISDITAVIDGLITPAAPATTYHFDWGQTTDYGAQAPATDESVPTGNGRDPVSQTLTGLLPDTHYHYRLVATTCGGCAAGTSYGADATFTTSSFTGEGGQVTIPAGTPPPTAGHRAVVGVIGGIVLIRVPGSAHLRRVSAGADVPIGSTIDATNGIVRVITALTRHHRLQAATVWGGEFVVRQGAKTGMTTFVLTGSLGCLKPTRHGAFTTALATHSRPGRHLWASDHNGQFSTRGHNSVATVRGTYWETVDTCAGTLTVVKRGRVSVLNLRRHRTVLVTAGHHYLARG